MAHFPKSNILLITDNEKLNLIAHHSDLAAFSSDAAMRHNIKRPRRAAVPVLDESAYAEYYCICKITNVEMVNFIKKIANILPDNLSSRDFPAPANE